MPELIYFEDLSVGQKFHLGSHTVSEEEIIAFARQFDPQPFHTDVEAAARSGFRGLVASGWHTASITMRLMVESFAGRSASLGSPGVDTLRWLLPVRPGDSLTGTMTITEVRPSASRPDRGVVRTRVEVVNQRGEVVLSMEPMMIYLRRTTD